MNLTYEQVMMFLLVVLRISGIFFSMPFFSNNAIKKKIRLGICFFVGILIYPVIPKDAKVVSNIGVYAFAFLAIKELVIGMIIGYFFMLVFSVVQTAAQVYSIDMGFGIVSVFDPISQLQLPILGQLKYFFMLSIFFFLGIHRKVLEILIQSFYEAPVGKISYNLTGIVEFITESFSYYFMLSIKLAIPVLGVLFVMNSVLGIMARIAPQMNVFFIGMPLKIMIGLGFLVLFTPYLYTYLTFVLEEAYDGILELLKISFSIKG